MEMPRMLPVRQTLATGRIDDPAAAVAQNIRDASVLDGLSGKRVAVTAGSRGIHCIDTILRAVVDTLKSAGAAPFIVPAMGSHGGGTSGGQRDMLASLGITAETMGVPVESEAEPELLGATPDGVPVFVDRNALAADGIVVVNRVKLHTAYHGRVESGLCKMVAVGLGKKSGAETMHRRGLGDVIVEAFRYARDRLPILFGVALLENARDEIMDVRVATPSLFEATDAELLRHSYDLFPRIPLREFDILIVDEMGKNISGTGMDTNVIGFWRRFGGEKDPDYTTLIVRSLTPESHGNAMGIGLADLIPRSLAGSIDRDATWTNAMTSQWSMGRIPITLEHDRACIEAALARHHPGTARIVRIANTLDLECFTVSETLRDAVMAVDSCVTGGDPEPMRFDGDGSLL